MKRKNQIFLEVRTCLPLQCIFRCAENISVLYYMISQWYSHIIIICNYQSCCPLFFESHPFLSISNIWYVICSDTVVRSSLSLYLSFFYLPSIFHTSFLLSCSFSIILSLSLLSYFLSSVVPKIHHPDNFILISYCDYSFFYIYDICFHSLSLSVSLTHTYSLIPSPFASLPPSPSPFPPSLGPIRLPIDDNTKLTAAQYRWR